MRQDWDRYAKCLTCSRRVGTHSYEEMVRCIQMRNKRGPTCGHKEIDFVAVNRDGSTFTQWFCGHQRGGGRSL